MKKHINFIKSSNVIIGSALLGVISFFLIPGITENTSNIFNAAFNIGFIVGLGLLVRLGKNWMKYLLLGITLLGIFLMASITETLKYNMVIGIISICQTLMQIWAVVLLFLIPKNKDNNLEVEKTAANK